MVADADVMNAVDAAAFLGIHVETLRRLARRNAIPCFKVGRDWRFRRAVLLRWADEQRAVGGGDEQRKTGVADEQRALDGASVLVVDDEAPFCRTMARALGALGYAVRTATSGARGLELVAEAPPELILLDLVMPEMNGPQFLTALRRRHEQLPVVIVTGYPESALVQQAMEHAPIMLLAKPVAPTLLERTLRSVLGERMAAEG